MTKEQLRMQMLAGIITESQYKQKIKEEETPESDQYDEYGAEAIEWVELGDNFKYNPKDHTFTWKSFVFLNDDNTAINGGSYTSEVQYTDYGNDRDEGEKVIDKMIDQLEKELEKGSQGDFGLNILAFSTHYELTIERV
jgi:hypothetical protein